MKITTLRKTSSTLAMQSNNVLAVGKIISNKITNEKENENVANEEYFEVDERTLEFIRQMNIEIKNKRSGRRC